MALSPEREGRLTASWHAEALGYGYLSGRQAWERWNGLSEPDERAKGFMEWGHLHEADALAFFEATHGSIVDRTGDDQLFTPYDDWSGCTTDGLVGDDGIWEAKCPQVFPETPKEGYWIQIQSQLHITKRQVAYVTIWTTEESGLWVSQANSAFWTTVEPHLKAYMTMLTGPQPPVRWKKPKLNLDFSWERIK